MVEMIDGGGDPAEIVARLGLTVLSDSSELQAVAEAVMADWPDKVSDYRSGKTGLLGFFVGQVIAATKGSADPRLTKELLAKMLSSDS